MSFTLKNINIQKILLYACFLWSIIFILYELDFKARMDDDYIGEQVYWLMQKGKVKSELMGGFNQIGLENYQSVFHKLWVYNGYVFCSIGGWSLTSLHIASLAYFLGFLAVFYLYQKKYIPSQAKKIILPLSLLIILAHHELKQMSWSFRPEIMVMSLGFTSYFFLTHFFENKKKYSLFFAGIFAGLAFLTHLNGLIYVVAGFLVLLLNKKWLESIIFGTLTAVVFSFYFLDIFINADLPYFLNQIKNDPSLVKNNNFFLNFLERIFMEQARYLFSEKEIPLTIVLTICLVKNWNYLKKEHSLLLYYTLTLMATMALWSYSKTQYLLILHLPFFVLLIALCVYQMFVGADVKQSKWIKYTFLVAISVYLVIDLWYSCLKISTNTQSWKRSTTEINRDLSVFIQKEEKNKPLQEVKVLAFGSFIFEEIKNYKAIKNINQYSFFIDYHRKNKMSFEELIKEASKDTIQYILFDKEHINYFSAEKALAQNPSIAKIYTKKITIL